MPITLPDLASLVERQTQLPVSERLSAVHAQGVQPWDVEDLRALSRASSGHLTILHLAPYNRTYRPGLAKVTFAELGGIVELIRSSLPGLQEFSLVVDGLREAEAHTKGLLGELCLENGGNISRLLVMTEELSVPYFNVVRLLAQICTPTAFVVIGRPFDFMYSGSPTNGATKYLAYLRAQSSNRRKHLAQIDFASLGATSYQDVRELDYHDDGRPKHRSEPRARGIEWAQIADGAACTAAASLPSFSQALDRFSQVAQRQRAPSATADQAELLREAEDLLGSADALALASQEIQRVLYDTGSVVSDIRRYVGALRRSGDVERD